MDKDVRIQKLTDALIEAHDERGTNVAIIYTNKSSDNNVMKDLENNHFQFEGVTSSSLLLYAIFCVISTFEDSSSGRLIIKDLIKKPRRLIELKDRLNII